MSAPVKAIPDFGVIGAVVDTTDPPVFEDAGFTGAAVPEVVEPLDVPLLVVVVVGAVVVVVVGSVVVVVSGTVVVVVVSGTVVVVVVSGTVVVVVVVVSGTVVVVVVVVSGTVVVVVVVVGRWRPRLCSQRPRGSSCPCHAWPRPTGARPLVECPR